MNELEIAFRSGFKKEASDMNKEAIGPLALLAPFATGAGYLGAGTMGQVGASLAGTAAMNQMGIGDWHPTSMAIDAGSNILGFDSKEKSPRQKQPWSVDRKNQGRFGRGFSDKLDSFDPNEFDDLNNFEFN